eukprot:6517846-Ditylum_brightwellii.AAC.1
MAEHVSNSALKYLAKIITIWVDIEEGRMEKEDCALALIYSTRAIGNTFKSNFDEDIQSAQVEASRKLATLVIDAKIFLYGQHFKGVWN